MHRLCCVILVQLVELAVLVHLIYLNTCFHEQHEAPPVEGINRLIDFVVTVGGMINLGAIQGAKKGAAHGHCARTMSATVLRSCVNDLDNCPNGQFYFFWGTCVCGVISIACDCWVSYLIMQKTEVQVLSSLETKMKPVAEVVAKINEIHEFEAPFWLLVPIVLHEFSPNMFAVWMIIVPGYVLSSPRLTITFETVVPFVCMFSDLKTVAPVISGMYLVLGVSFWILIVFPGLETKNEFCFRAWVAICRASIMMSWVWWNMRYAYTIWDPIPEHTNPWLQGAAVPFQMFSRLTYEVGVLFCLFTVFKTRRDLRELSAWRKDAAKKRGKDAAEKRR